MLQIIQPIHITRSLYLQMSEYLTKVMDFEWLQSALPALYYNITVFLSVLSCEETSPTYNKDARTNTEDVLIETTETEEAGDSLFGSVWNFFGDAEPSYNDLRPAEDSNSQQCTSFLHFDSNQTISVLTITVGLVITGTIFFIIIIHKILYSRRSGKKQVYSDEKEIKLEDEALSQDKGVKQEVRNDDEEADKDKNEEEVVKSSDSPKAKKADLPVVIDVPKVNDQVSKNILAYPSLEEIFERTLAHFLKELDHSLGLEMCSATDRLDANTSLPTSASSSTVSSITSPRLARRSLRRSVHSTQSLSLDTTNFSQADEVSSKCWILYENFRKQLGWNFPDTNIDSVNFGQIMRNNDILSSILQFLHQNCPIRPRQWNAATCIIDYSLFLLEQELRMLSVEANELIKFSRFEGIGSALNGTLTGSADRFEVLVVIDLSSFSDITVLHSNFWDGISSGHVLLSMKDGGSSSKQNLKCHRKACIQGLFGFYLLPQQFEDYTEALMKRAVIKLNRDQKNKMDRLPFKFQMSSNKKMVLTFDTRLIQGLGLGVGELSVKFTPAICLSLPQFGILPPLYAVPPVKPDSKASQNTNSAANTVLGRIFRDQGHNDLLWTICTEKLHTSIIQGFERKFYFSGVKCYHRECLMILVALFSQGNKNNLLNKGEIDANVLYTIVSFLLQESEATAWTLPCLGDRLSDSVHFLKSAFQNMWLPNFVVHNPHLTDQMPALGTMSSLLSGRQQNLLADVSNDAALKVLDYIEQRLQETGLSRCIKAEFSANMWEYEFFMFG